MTQNNSSPFLCFRDDQPQGGISYSQLVSEGLPVFRRSLHVQYFNFPRQQAAKLTDPRTRREGGP
ncbi:MAG: hypothetical protein BWY09_03205 [Candidatus Hydrogenedentes bacterium ADurb.Bin179]|nr:MAG: hypothetical protein BWY09_03205 [Candidatus Hydrogenedentes bacterium ADurb.Bin179]